MHKSPEVETTDKQGPWPMSEKGKRTSTQQTAYCQATKGARCSRVLQPGRRQTHPAQGKSTYHTLTLCNMRSRANPDMESL